MLPLPRMSGSGFCSHPKLENVGTSVLVVVAIELTTLETDRWQSTHVG